MFWIPKGWVPYYAEWLLSFPRAPLGSISIQAWFLACTAVIILVLLAVIAFITRSLRGLRMRALAENEDLAVYRGIKVHRRDASGKVNILDLGLNDPVVRDDVIYVKESLF